MPKGLPAVALDERLAIVGTSGSGKTYTAKGLIEPLHLVLDEADMWAPQRPLPDAYALLGRIEEIVRRGRVRGFLPWLITQRPAVVHKDVLSQADILIAMKLTSSQECGMPLVTGWAEPHPVEACAMFARTAAAEAVQKAYAVKERSRD